MIAGFLAAFPGDAKHPFASLLMGPETEAMSVWKNGRTALAFVPSQAPGDLSGFPAADGPHAVTACGRIDNLPELRSELHLPAATPAAAVVLACYRRWERDMATHLLGDFTVAVHDERLGQLHLIRDRLGATPLFFARTRSGIAFASSVDQLLRLPEITRKPNEARIADYLVDLPHDREATFYRDVGSIPPAHTATVNASSIRMARYWQLSAEPQLRLSRDEDYVAQFQERFVTAVRRCTAETGRVAVALSGGLDSSSIACVTSLLLGKTLETFTATFPTFPFCDERRYVDQVVSATNAHPAYVPLTTDIQPEPWELVKRVTDPTVLAWYPVISPEFALAKAAGHRVVLTGSLGDVGGGGVVNSLDELFARREFARLTRELSLLPRAKAARAAARFLALSLLPNHFQALRKARSRAGLVKRFPGLRFVSSDLSKRYDLAERATELDAKAPSMNASKGAVEILHSTWPETELGVARWCGESSGIVTRQPFGDTELLAWTARLPAEVRLRWGLSRWILRAAMSGLVPDEVRLRRQKTYFDTFYDAVITMWLKRLGNWAPAAPFVNTEAVMHATGRMPRRSTELHALWTCGTLLLWLEREADNDRSTT